jgi:hypothetical protein
MSNSNSLTNQNNLQTKLPELAKKRYVEFIESFNKFKLIDTDVDIKSFNYEEKLWTFYEKVSKEEKLFKYLLARDKLLFHKNYKLSFIHKINLYNLIDSKIDEGLISFVWETIQMICLIIADSQEVKNQAQVDALLDKLDGLGKKKGTIDMKRISSVISKIDSSVLTEFLSAAGLDSIDFTKIDVTQLQDIKNITPDKIKSIIASTGLDKVDINGIIDKLALKGDGEKGKVYLMEIINKLVDDYDRSDKDDKTEFILDFAIEKAQDKLQEFIEEGKLSLYDMIAGSKIIREDKDQELANKLTRSKLYKDGSTLSVKELISRFTARMMSQLGKDRATGNITDEQMKGLEDFLRNQKIA